eukprot:scaffold82068_cov18-Tisochrysis_lutea.AAC.1
MPAKYGPRACRKGLLVEVLPRAPPGPLGSSCSQRAALHAHRHEMCRTNSSCVFIHAFLPSSLCMRDPGSPQAQQTEHSATLSACAWSEQRGHAQAGQKALHAFARLSTPRTVLAGRIKPRTACKTQGSNK